MQAGRPHGGWEHRSQPKAVIMVWACFNSAGDRRVKEQRGKSEASLAFIASSKSARPRRGPNLCRSNLTCQENLELVCREGHGNRLGLGTWSRHNL